MSGTNDDPSARPQLGDYLLGPPLSEGVDTVTYEANQISVRRKVILECVRPTKLDDEGVVEAFLADVRAKAALDYPVISSVYEAVRSKEAVYCARERPPGRSLGELHGAGETLDPSTVLLLLEGIGKALLYLAEQNVRTNGLEPGDLYIDEPDILRIDNLAVSGKMDLDLRRQDRQTVSILLTDLVKLRRPGATRTKKLLSNLAEEEAPNWASVIHTAGKLARELTDTARIAVGTEQEQAPAQRSLRAPLMFLRFAVVLVVLVAALICFLLGRRGSAAPRDLDQMVSIEGAKAFGPDREVTFLPAFWIDAHEVTMAEYREFLSALTDDLAPEQRDAYDHPDQPETKSGHIPGDWEALKAAVESGEPWQGLEVDLNCPVVNVDWWDGYAFAKWRGGRLPSQAEWFAASEGLSLTGSGWGPVDQSDADRTPRGVEGLAGNVSEWINEWVPNTADPGSPKAPFSCGASYLRPKNGVFSRKWHPSGESRRPDVGFRVLREVAP